MSNQQTNYDKNFRSGYDSNDPVLLLQDTLRRVQLAQAAVTQAQADLASLTTQVGLKAPLDSPAFTGSPTAPDIPTPGTTTSTRILNDRTHTNHHARGRFTSTSAPANYGAGWQTLTHTGTADLLTGGVAVGPGNQGLLVPPGVWAISFSGYLTFPGGAIRLLAALSGGIYPTNVLNTTGASTADAHFHWSHVVPLSSAVHLRPQLYNDTHVLAVHGYTMNVARVAPLV